MSQELDLSALDNKSVAPPKPDRRKKQRITAPSAKQSETTAHAGKQAAESMNAALTQISTDSAGRMAQAAIAQVKQDAAVYLTTKRKAEAVVWGQIADLEAAEWEVRFPEIERSTDIESLLADVLPDLSSVNLLPVAIPDVRALLGGD